MADTITMPTPTPTEEEGGKGVIEICSASEGHYKINRFTNSSNYHDKFVC